MNEHQSFPDLDLSTTYYKTEMVSVTESLERFGTKMTD